MPTAKFCCTCIHWEKDILIRTTEKFGICNDVIASSKIIQDRETKLNEDNTVYTEAYFGCIYWRENDGSLLSIDDVVKDEIKEFQANVKDIVQCQHCNKLNNITNDYCIWCKLQL